MSQIEPVSIIIIDDDENLRLTLGRLFEVDGRIRVLATSGLPSDTVPLLRKHKPQVLLLDIEFQGQPIGIDVLREVRRHSDITVKILIYTIYAQHETIFEALRSGANSYVWKDETTDSITDAILDTAVGKAHISPTIAQMVLDHFEKYRQLLVERSGIE
jgi:two-component system, NarL family, response regulator LiaR